MFSIEEQNFILLGNTGNPWFVILPPPYVRRSDNERGKWKRAVLISRPCSTMNESFIIPVPFAEYRVNVTTDLWVKNGNGRPNGKEEPTAAGASYTRCVRATTEAFLLFPAVELLGFPSIASLHQASLRGGGPSPRLEKVTNNPAREGREEVSSSRANRARSASAV